MNSRTHIAHHEKKQQLQGLIYALVGTALFSIKPIFIKIAYQYGGDATTIMSLRALSSLPFYLIVLLVLSRDEQKRSLVREHGWQAAFVGILGYYVASYLDIAALAYISAQLERLLIFLFPSFVVLLSWLCVGQRPTRNVIHAVALGYLGIAFILFHDVQSLGSEIWKGSGLAIRFCVYFFSLSHAE